MTSRRSAGRSAFARANPGCLPSVTFYPEPGAARYVRAALDAGARIFKVHLQVGGFSPADPSDRRAGPARPGRGVAARGVLGGPGGDVRVPGSGEAGSGEAAGEAAGGG
jgi:hypothetical protein